MATRFIGTCSARHPVAIDVTLRSERLYDRTGMKIISAVTFVTFADGKTDKLWNGRLQTTCPACSAPIALDRVNGRKSEHLCDARCTGATGHNCECSCGGQNHGRDHMGA